MISGVIADLGEDFHSQGRFDLLRTKVVDEINKVVNSTRTAECAGLQKWSDVSNETILSSLDVYRRWLYRSSSSGGRCGCRRS